MNKSMDPNTILVSFLRETADSLENRTLSNPQLQRLSEFYMSYLFAQEIENDKKQTKRLSRKRRDMTNQDFMKFISLGYYVYNHIIDDEPLQVETFE